MKSKRDELLDYESAVVRISTLLNDIQTILIALNNSGNYAKYIYKIKLELARVEGKVDFWLNMIDEDFKKNKEEK